MCLSLRVPLFSGGLKGHEKEIHVLGSPKGRRSTGPPPNKKTMGGFHRVSLGP